MPPSDAPVTDLGVTVEFCDERRDLPPGETLTIGRDADITIDDNKFLHRVFLMIAERDGYWFIHNVGNQLGATVADATGTMEAFLAPGASIPLVFGTTSVVFTAGPSTYEVLVTTDTRVYSPPVIPTAFEGGTTVGPIRLTVEQQLLILALAEPRLRRSGRLAIDLPSSQEAARRLGWRPTKFNRKLDNVCDKLSKLGVRGLHGDLGAYASNRRARLVEYAVATRLVTPDDLAVLDCHVCALEGASR
ncbi:MAG: hypothetical protein ACI8RE_002092 [Ilumatobacter sp.]|jgi:hypothetical protein